MGVISMKLVGEGAFTTREDRQAAMRFAFRTRCRLRNGRLQEHGRDRRSDRESESGARVTNPHLPAIHQRYSISVLSCCANRIPPFVSKTL